MELTARDRRLITDVVLHHVITRDQMIALGYFPCITRANRRLLTLRENGLIERVRLNHCLMPKQAVYRASKRATDVVNERVAAILRTQSLSTLQFDHALAVIDARIKFLELGMKTWLSEPQCRHRFELQNGGPGRVIEVRPDGVAIFDNRLFFIEVDRGNVSLPRIKTKLQSFATYHRAGLVEKTYGKLAPAVLLITTGEVRVRNIKTLAPRERVVPILVMTTEEFHALTRLAEMAR